MRRDETKGVGREKEKEESAVGGKSGMSEKAKMSIWKE